MSNMSVNRSSIKALLHAAEKGSISKIDNCLKSIPVDSTDDQSQVALHFAAANGHENVVRHLIKRGAKLDSRNWCGWTAMMFAAYYGHINVVSVLIQNNAQVNCMNDRKASPLICAARSGHKSVIEMLLDNGAEINADVTNDSWTTSLMAAAQHGHHSIVNLLLQYSVHVNFKNKDTGYTALMLAASNGHLETVHLLIEKGDADPNLMNVCNLTAYELSDIRNQPDVQAYLQERTTKYVQRPLSAEKNRTNLIEAVKSGKLQKVLHILNHPKHPADVNMRDAEGGTPLIYASVGGNIEIVRILLKRNADTDAQDHLNGWTALMQATVKGNVEIVRLLIASGADITIRSHNGLAVFDLANIAAIPEVTRLVVMGKEGLKSEQQEKKSLFSKIGSKFTNKRAQPLSRVSVQRKDIVDGSAVGDEMDDNDDSDELKKTSSVLSVFDANKSLGITGAKARITLPTPQVKLPDDVVAPVIPPIQKLPSFDLPMPAMSSRLGNSNESDGFNTSNDSTSMKSIKNQFDSGYNTQQTYNSTYNSPQQTTTTPFMPSQQQQQQQHQRIRRPQMNNSPLQRGPSPPNYSPQSSMTSSDITSISRAEGRGVMPSLGFHTKRQRTPPSLDSYQNPALWATSSPPITQQQQQQNARFGKPMPLPPLNDLSIRSLDHTTEKGTSQDVYVKSGNLAAFLERIELERYTSAFDVEAVDYETLQEMDDSDLKSIGIDQTINRDKILVAVKKERERHARKHAPSNLSHFSLPTNQPYSLPIPPASPRAGSVVSTPGHIKLAPLPGFLSSGTA